MTKFQDEIITYMKATGKNIHTAYPHWFNFTGEVRNNKISKRTIASLIKQKLIKQTISEDGNEYIYILL